MKTFTLTFDENDLAIIAAGLGELPMKVSKPLFDKISAQVNELNKPAEPPPSE